MLEYYCCECGWKGDELIEGEEDGDVCPECESSNWSDCDGVSEEDYRKQNPRERVNE